MVRFLRFTVESSQKNPCLDHRRVPAGEKHQVSYFATADDTVLKISTFISLILGSVRSGVQHMSAEFIDSSN